MTGGIYEDVEREIALGCPLSPLMGAFYLKRLDERMVATGLAYARFMDDWVILAPTRWKLRAAIRLVNKTLAELKLQQHPDKTFIGRVSRGFDFLGYLFTPAGLEVAPRAVLGHPAPTQWTSPTRPRKPQGQVVGRDVSVADQLDLYRSSLGSRSREKKRIGSALTLTQSASE